jgi:hypothetical protein
MGALSRYKYLYAAMLPIFLLMLFFNGLPLATDYLAGKALAPDSIGSIAMSALQIPMWMSFLHLARLRPSALRHDLTARVFERGPDIIVMSSMVLWALGVGVLLNAFLSGEVGRSFFGFPQGDFWLGLLSLAMSLYLAASSLMPKATLRLTLSTDGIAYSKVKGSVIPWEDVSDIRFVKFPGQNRIAVDVIDPVKYGLKKSPLMIDPHVFHAAPDAMMELFKQERTLNLLS